MSGRDLPNFNVVYFENMKCRGSLELPILSIYIMTDYRPQHTRFHASLESRSSIVFDHLRNERSQHTKQRPTRTKSNPRQNIESTEMLDDIIPVYSSRKRLAHRFSTSRKCIALYAMMMKAPEMTASPITSLQ